MCAKWMSCFWLLFVLGGNVVPSALGSRVLELSDRFIDIKHEGQWFIMFYAPWCGHCKRTEPIWGHIAQALVHTNIRVGKIDCTRFTAAGQHFKITSYPTILFIKGHQEYVYNGDRTKDEMLAYTARMTGPPVQAVAQMDTFSNLKTEKEIFFTYVGPRNGSLWTTYHSTAEIFQPHGFFYTTSKEIATRHFDISTLPTVLVYKENNHYHFPLSSDFQTVEESFLNKTLHRWVNEERFKTFPKVTRNNFAQISQTGKYLVLAVVEENKLEEIASSELEFRDMVEAVIRKYYDEFHKDFQFGWIGSPEIAHSIVMDDLPTPHLIVLNSTTFEHHIPDDEPERLTENAMQLFLQDIRNEKAKVYGGNSLPIRVYRTYFEGKRYIYDMWHGNPILTVVLFGLPLGFLSLILYSIFCADILDADEDEEEEELHAHAE